MGTVGVLLGFKRKTAQAYGKAMSITEGPLLRKFGVASTAEKLRKGGGEEKALVYRDVRCFQRQELLLASVVVLAAHSPGRFWQVGFRLNLLASYTDRNASSFAAHSA